MTGVHAKSCHILWINVVLILLQPTNFKNHNMTEQSSSPDISYEACSYLDACWSILVNNDIKNPPGKCIFFKLICREMVLRFYGSTIWKIYFSLLKFLKCWLIWNYKSSAREIKLHDSLMWVSIVPMHYTKLILLKFDWSEQNIRNTDLWFTIFFIIKGFRITRVQWTLVPTVPSSSVTATENKGLFWNFKDRVSSRQPQTYKCGNYRDISWRVKFEKIPSRTMNLKQLTVRSFLG